MAIQLIISDKVGVTVKGAIKDEDGKSCAFDFLLVCKRLDSDTIDAKLKAEPEKKITDFMVDIALDWKRVKAEDGSAAPFSADNLRALFGLAGLPRLAFNTYLTEVGVQEKN